MESSESISPTRSPDYTTRSILKKNSMEGESKKSRFFAANFRKGLDSISVTPRVKLRESLPKLKISEVACSKDKSLTKIGTGKDGVIEKIVIPDNKSGSDEKSELDSLALQI
jgi:hypothetical protein